jgi:toxin ParE1/3/4
MNIIFSELAESDIEAIGDYIARDNPHRAVTFIRDMRGHCRQITTMPKGFPLRHDISAGLRMASYRDYLIFYHETESAIRIERILHGARDYTALF